MKFRLFVVGALMLAACGGGQKVKDAPPGTEPADLDAPTAEELAASPCGNPNWSELPPGSDKPAEDQEDGQEAAP